MISIRNDSLHIAFPEVHTDAEFTCEFERTLRIPDDESVHFLPPGLGDFPLRNIDRFGGRVPAAWRERGVYETWGSGHEMVRRFASDVVFDVAADSSPVLTFENPRERHTLFHYRYAFGDRFSRLGGGKVTDSSTMCEYLLDEALISMVPGAAFGADDYIRLSFACSMEQLEDGLNRLEKALA